MITKGPIFSEQQLLSLPRLGKAEVVDGRLIVTPAGSEHGGIGSCLVTEMLRYARMKNLGWVFDSSTGFWMADGNLRSPDVAFVRRDRLKGRKRLPRGFFESAPDLAVEILSPGDRPEELHAKIEDYFSSGCRLLWILDLDARTAEIYRSATEHRTIGDSGDLDGGEVLPGFRLKLADLLDAADFS